MNQVLFKLEMLRYLSAPKSVVLGYLPPVELGFLFFEEAVASTFRERLELVQIKGLQDLGNLLTDTQDHFSIWLNDNGSITFWTQGVRGYEKEYKFPAHLEVPWACRMWEGTVGIHFVLPGIDETFLSLIEL